MIGTYFLQIKFGGNIVPVSISNLRELTITQDLNAFLPDFRLRLSDNTGTFTHTLPFDKNMSQVYIELARSEASSDKNAFTFDVYRRQPGGNQSTPAAIYDVSGLLSSTGLFAPNYSRGFSGNVQTNLQNLGLTELGANSTNVGASLNYNLNLLQPKWNDVQFLDYLTRNLFGNNGEYGYKCAIQTQNYKNIFLFSSLTELMTNPVSYKFVLADTPYQDRWPVYNWYVYDNYKLYGSFGNQVQSYSFFDWNAGNFVTNTLNIQDYYSLSDYFAIDKSDPVVSTEIEDTGRANAFQGMFEGLITGGYANRLINLVKMWITTQGLPNAIPGQTVEIFFPQGSTASDLYSYQYSGYWLIEKVVHNCGDMFYTKLLLTRHGVDTDKKTSLLPANTSKRI